MFPLRIDEKGCLELLKKKSQPIFEGAKMAKEIADDNHLLWGEIYYTPDIVEKLERN